MRTPSRLVATLAMAIALTACSGGDTPDTADTSDAAPGGGSVSASGTDEVTWASTELSTTAGSIDVTLACGDAVNHAFVVEGVDGDAPIATCDPGATGTGTVDLEAGSYTFFCNVPGHREAGMEGTLTVS